MSTPTVRMRDIAREAGVSQPTVSHVLGGRAALHRISPATQRRVREVATRMGYRVDAGARSLRTGRYGAVALLLSTNHDRSYLPQTMLDAVHNALAQHDLSLVLARLPDQQFTDAGYVPKVLRELGVDGLLIDYTDQIPARMVDLIEGHALPAVWINVRRDHDAVHPDDVQIGQMATRHLLTRGHKHIAYIDLSAGWQELQVAHYSRSDRQVGYRQVMAEAGLPAIILRPEYRLGPHERAAEMERLLRAHPHLTGLITYSPQASPLCRAMLRMGRQFVRDMSWVTFSEQPSRFDFDFSAIEPLRGATVLLPHAALGREAVAMLRERMRQPGVSIPTVAVPSTAFDAGDTCGPVPAQSTP